MERYFDGFSNKEDVMGAFCVSEEQSEGVEILYAWYDTSYDYEGYATVIFRKDGKIYEVNGSHCSCYGLEGQWEPEETSVVALLARPNIADEAKAILQSL